MPLAQPIHGALHGFDPKLTSDVNPYQMQFLGSVAAMIGLGWSCSPARCFPIWRHHVDVTEREVIWVVGMGIAATLGHAFIVFAAEKAPANLLAPFRYVEIIGATALAISYFQTSPPRARFLVSESSFSAAFICFTANMWWRPAIRQA